MAIAYVQSKSADSAAGTTHNLTFNSSVTDGSLLIAYFRISAAFNAFSSIADNLGNTWQAAETAYDDLNSDTVGTYYVANSFAGAGTVTLTVTSSAVVRWAIHEYSGIVGTSPLDQHSKNTGGSGAGTINSPDVTTTQADELLFGTFDQGGAGCTDIVAANSFTLREKIIATDVKIGTLDKIVSSTTTDHSAVTTTGSGSGYSSGIATFKAGSSGHAPAAGTYPLPTFPTIRYNG